MTIQLGAEDIEVLLPLTAGDILGTKPLELKQDGVMVQLPSALLKALRQLVPAEQAKDAVISFKLEEVGSQTAASLVAKAAAVEKAKLKQGSKMYALDLNVRTKDGKAYKLEHFIAPVTIAFPVDSVIHGKLAGIYHISDQGQLKYAGGKLVNGLLTAEVSQLSYYAVLEYDKSFADLVGHWAEQAINELAAKHIVNGTSDTIFSPSQQLTRAQFAAMLVRALGLESTQDTAFTDVDGDAWYASAVAAAYQHGLVNGRGKGTFAPNEAITREELAVMLYRAYGTKGNASPSPEAPDLKDRKQISSWALQEVNEALALGLMKGHANGTFTPQAKTTRAESAQALLNLLDRLQ